MPRNLDKMCIKYLHCSKFRSVLKFPLSVVSQSLSPVPLFAHCELPSEAFIVCLSDVISQDDALFCQT